MDVQLTEVLHRDEIISIVDAPRYFAATSDPHPASALVDDVLDLVLLPRDDARDLTLAALYRTALVCRRLLHLLFHTARGQQTLARLPLLALPPMQQPMMRGWHDHARRIGFMHPHWSMSRIVGLWPHDYVQRVSLANKTLYTEVDGRQSREEIALLESDAVRRVFAALLPARIKGPDDPSCCDDDAADSRWQELQTNRAVYRMRRHALHRGFEVELRHRLIAYMVSYFRCVGLSQEVEVLLDVAMVDAALLPPFRATLWSQRRRWLEFVTLSIDALRRIEVAELKRRRPPRAQRPSTAAARQPLRCSVAPLGYVVDALDASSVAPRWETATQRAARHARSEDAPSPWSILCLDYFKDVMYLKVRDLKQALGQCGSISRVLTSFAAFTGRILSESYSEVINTSLRRAYLQCMSSDAHVLHLGKQVGSSLRASLDPRMFKISTQHSASARDERRWDFAAEAIGLDVVRVLGTSLGRGVAATDTLSRFSGMHNLASAARFLHMAIEMVVSDSPQSTPRSVRVTEGNGAAAATGELWDYWISVPPEATGLPWYVWLPAQRTTSTPRRGQGDMLERSPQSARPLRPKKRKLICY